MFGAFHLADPSKIIIPAYCGKNGHLSFFPVAIIRDIFYKSNLREIISEDPARVKYIDVPDEGVIIDIDTEEDYEAVVRKKKETLNDEGP